MLVSDYQTDYNWNNKMKVISFNINGLRARLHQLQALIDKHQPDVIGLQEIKVHDEAFPLADVEAMGYKVYHHGQKAHYGVALLCKQEPVEIQKGFPTDDEDAQRMRFFRLKSGRLKESIMACNSPGLQLCWATAHLLGFAPGGLYLGFSRRRKLIGFHRQGYLQFAAGQNLNRVLQ